MEDGNVDMIDMGILNVEDDDNDGFDVLLGNLNGDGSKRDDPRNYNDKYGDKDDEMNRINGAMIAPQEPPPIQPTPTTTTQNKYDD